MKKLFPTLPVLFFALSAVIFFGKPFSAAAQQHGQALQFEQKNGAVKKRSQITILPIQIEARQPKYYKFIEMQEKEQKREAKQAARAGQQETDSQNRQKIAEQKREVKREVNAADTTQALTQKPMEEAMADSLSAADLAVLEAKKRATEVQRGIEAENSIQSSVSREAVEEREREERLARELQDLAESKRAAQKEQVEPQNSSSQTIAKTAEGSQERVLPQLPQLERYKKKLRQKATSVQKTYDAMKSLRFVFQQQTSGELTGRPQRGSGWAVFLRKKGAQKMRWEYDEPDKQVIVSDGRTLAMYFQKLKQMIITGTEAMNSDLTYSFFTGRSSLLKDFTITEPDDNYIGDGTASVLKLIPRLTQQHVEHLHIWVDQRNLIRRISVEDHFGTITILNLSKIEVNSLRKVNPAEQDAIFTFTPPEETEIIEQ